MIDFQSSSLPIFYASMKEIITAEQLQQLDCVYYVSEISKFFTNTHSICIPMVSKCYF